MVLESGGGGGEGFRGVAVGGRRGGGAGGGSEVDSCWMRTNPCVRREADAEILRTRAGGVRGVRRRCGCGAAGYARRAFEIGIGSSVTGVVFRRGSCTHVTSGAAGCVRDCEAVRSYSGCLAAIVHYT